MNKKLAYIITLSYSRYITMKKKLFFLFLLSGVLGFSQQKRFEINWEGSKTLIANISKIEVPSFNSEHFNYDEVKGRHFNFGDVCY